MLGRTFLLVATLVSFLSLFGSASAQTAATDSDWLNWRGPSQNGFTKQTGFPTSLDSKTLKWKTALPGKGCSTPIVVGDAIYVTSPTGDKDALVSLDRSGEQNWVCKFGLQDKGKHRNGSGSNASPVSDGKAIFVYFKSGTLAAVEPDGEIRWQVDLIKKFGKVNIFWDHGTSPVLTSKHLIFARIHGGKSWVAAFDKTTGKIAWKVDRNFKTPIEGDHCYSTPVVIKHDDVESILVWGAEHLTIHNAADGEVTWSCGGFNVDKIKLWPSVASPLVVGDMVIVPSGRDDKKIPILHGVRIESMAMGDQTDSAHVWKRTDVSTFVPSPTAHDGKVYLVRDRGQVECLDPKTGDSIWSDSLPRNRNKYYSSPLITDGLIFAPREDGVVFTIGIADGKFSLRSTDDLKESVISSPIPMGNNVLVRGERHLFCFGKTSN